MSVQTGDGTYAVRGGTLDGDPTLEILGHMYVEECVSWYQIGDDLPQHARWPAGFGPSASG